MRLKSYKITPNPPSDWSKVQAETVDVYQTLPISSINDLKKPVGAGIFNFSGGAEDTDADASTGATKQGMVMRIAPQPFAEGACRLAYHGQVAKAVSELGADGHQMVFKSFKHAGKTANKRKQHLKQMEVSNVACFLARSYNASKCRPSHCSAVHFLPSVVLESKDDGREEQCYCVERALAGVSDGSVEFKKFSNNTGYWNEDELDETLLRFSEYTYNITGGYLMLTDLQGVKEACGSFMLTDPVVLCTDVNRFGHTNLGEAMMKKCLASTQAYRKSH